MRGFRNLRKWLRFPSRAGLLLGLGALSIAGARAETAATVPTPPSPTLGGLSIRSEAGRIYVSEERSGLPGSRVWLIRLKSAASRRCSRDGNRAPRDRRYALYSNDPCRSRGRRVSLDSPAVRQRCRQTRREKRRAQPAGERIIAAASTARCDQRPDPRQGLTGRLQLKPI